MYFSTRVLRLAEEPEDEEALGPRAQGTLLHEVLEAFFDAWQARGGAITTASLDEARALFAEVAEARLAALPATDAAIQRTRLLGSPVAEGVGDIVLAAEAERDRGVPVVERLLEFTLDGETRLVRAARRGRSGWRPRRIASTCSTTAPSASSTTSSRVRRTGTTSPSCRPTRRPRASGWRRRAGDRGGRPTRRTSRSARRALRAAGQDEEGLAEALAEGEARLVRAVDGIERGVFPPAPAEAFRCTYCAFSGVCRKDYVGDE